MVLRCVFDGNSTNTTVTHASFKNVNTVQVNKQHVLDSRGVEGQCSFGLKSLLVFCAVTVLFFFFFSYIVTECRHFFHYQFLVVCLVAL